MDAKKLKKKKVKKKLKAVDSFSKMNKEKTKKTTWTDGQVLYTEHEPKKGMLLKKTFDFIASP